MTESRRSACDTIGTWGRGFGGLIGLRQNFAVDATLTLICSVN